MLKVSRSLEDIRAMIALVSTALVLSVVLFYISDVLEVNVGLWIGLMWLLVVVGLVQRA
jgi:hypothetical protein